MSVPGRGRFGARAAIACAALYALVLQALLLGALPHPGPAAGGVICSHEASESGPGQGSGQMPDGTRHPCCVLAGAAPAPLLPAPAEAPRPATVATLVEPWRAAALTARPPPTHHASPRGPPAA